MRQSNLCLLILACISLFVFLPAHAQKVFHVGDRVKVSPSGLKDEKYWRAGTITEVHNYTPKKAYTVACDPSTPGGAPNSFLVNEDWVKPLTAADAAGPANGATVPAPAPGKPTQAATPPAGKVACPASDPDSRGATAFERSIRGAIREDFEHEPRLHEDGKVTVAFQNVIIGPSHAWQQLVDPMDARGKTIYEVRSNFTTCTDYFTRIEYVKRDRAFACYKNNAGKWVCEVVAATNTNIKDQTTSVDKKP